ncbi:MAG: radical SAM protein [Nitrospirae bacterium]|nr:radical SAM protein [Nitrospirota bacterium]
MTNKLKSLAARLLRNWRGPKSDVGTEKPAASQVVQPAQDDEDVKKISLQKAYLQRGVFPAQFSVVLGSAPCNHSCLFCPQSVVKPGKAQWLDMKVLEKSLNEMPEENISLNMSSYSETMQCPVLFPAIEMMKRIRPNLPIVMATNGSQMTVRKVEKLIELGLDKLSFSFDAADRESYKQLMQKDDFEQVERNLEMICRVRNEHKSNMQILTHIMGFENQRELYETFKQRWDGIVDVVSFRSVGNWGDEGLGLKKRLEESGFVAIYKKPERRFPCTSVFMHFKLAPDGHYYPCVAYVPQDNYAELQLLSLGDARETTFNEAWDRLEVMRQKHVEGKWDECPYCAKCDVWGLWEDMWFERNGLFDLDESIKKLNYWEKQGPSDK